MEIFASSTNYEMFAQGYMEWNLFYITAKRVHCKEELQGDQTLNDHSHSQYFCSEQMWTMLVQCSMANSLRNIITGKIHHSE